MSAFNLLSNAGRARDIATVFARHGFAEIIEQLGPPPGFLKSFVPAPKGISLWEHLRMAAEELGPTFIKSGQVLSMRPDLLPEDLVYELRKLQCAVSPLPFEQMREVLEAELGKVEELFSSFEETPVASASLAQVYRATLKEEGLVVAVKVQRPGLEKLVEADLELIAFFAAQLSQRIQALRPYNLPALVLEIRQAFERELDFKNESRNLRFFNATNPFATEIYAPALYEKYTRRSVLVMDFVEGVPLDKATHSSATAKHLAMAGARSLFHQVLRVGFFHADPHTGNLLIVPDGRLCILDWGQCGQLTRRMRYFLADLFEAAAAMDAERIVASASLLAASGRRPDFRSMEKEVMGVLREHLNYPIGQQQIGRVILALMNIFSRQGIDITQDYCLMAKSVLSIEEAARTLDPDFDLRSAAAPILRDLQKERFSPLTIARQFRRGLVGALSRMGDLPIDLHRLAQRISQDDLTINFQHRGLEELDEAINKASSRLTLALIVGAIIVGSSLVIHAGVKPLIFGGVSLLGVFGYLLSLMIGLWIIWDIFRHGRHK